MAHKNKVSLFKQASDILVSKVRFGQSRHQAKSNGEDHLYIFSRQTLRNYLTVAKQFCVFCKTNYHCKTIAECRQHVDDFIRFRSTGCSPWTVKKEAAALAKLFGCSSTEFVSTMPRHRAEIKRSRLPAKRDAHFSEKRNADLVNFCRSTGLRRSEVEALRGDDYTFENGEMYIHVRHGKGGKERYAVVIGDIEPVLRLMERAGDGKVFPRVHSAADIHSYRAEYAASLYSQLARPIKNVPKSQRYYCRLDKRKIVYDRTAMRVVSQMLGHNRINVIAENYLYTIQ